MKRLLITIVLTIVLLVTAAAPVAGKPVRTGKAMAVQTYTTALTTTVAASAPALDRQKLQSSVAELTSRESPQFAQSLAAGSGDDLFVSATSWGETANRGQVWKITVAGDRIPLGPPLDVGQGILTGLAGDGAGGVFVAVASFSETVPPGVLHIAADGSLAQVLRLSSASYPTGLVVHAGSLCVCDSTLGTVWRVPIANGTTPTTTAMTTPAPSLRNSLLRNEWYHRHRLVAGQSVQSGELTEVLLHPAAWFRNSLLRNEWYHLVAGQTGERF